MKTGIRHLGLRAVLLVAPLLGLVNAYPSPSNLAKLARDTPDLDLDVLVEALKEHEKKRSTIDPLAAPISVTGANVFIAPNFTAGDVRGPCPGLNALANHGYLPRNGVANLVDSIISMNVVFGFGIDLGTLPNVFSTVVVGNAVSLNPGYSIGGVSPNIQPILGGLGGILATPRGIDVTHNLIEADGSSTRDDIYVTGNARTMNMTKFLENYNAIPVNGAMTMNDVYAKSAQRFDESVATNPYFYYGPYSGTFARHGGYMFNGRLLSNHSAQYPRGGNITRDVYASFCGVYPDGKGGLQYKEGWEQIPANWYRIVGDYSFADLALDVVAACVQYPKLASIGGNLGAVNTFTGVDLANVTGGVLNAVNLLQGNNLLCFALEALKMVFPNQLASVLSTVAAPVTQLTTLVPIALLNLSCPAFTDMTMDGTDLFTALLNKYPGAKKSGYSL